MKTLVHSNPWFAVFRRQSGLNDWYQVEAPDSAMVIGRTHENQVLFIRGCRDTTGLFQAVELPGGAIMTGETPSAAAMRETAEETGYSASSLISVGEFVQVPAISAARCHVFEALVERGGEPRLEYGERWTSVLIHETKIQALIASGSIRDAGTLAALCMFLSRRSHPNAIQ